MTALQWSQVHAWRMSQHGLFPHFSSQDFAGAVTSTGGIQAQVMSAAELAVCTRVEGFSPHDVQAATPYRILCNGVSKKAWKRGLAKVWA